STTVARLKQAGAIIVGTFKLHQFAFGAAINPHWGVSRNPWNREYVTSGSSSGSGAAVSASLIFGSLGTDTGGSIRGPASFCGIVGIKPTYGRVSRFGVFPLSWSLDHAGPMTKTVKDTAIMLNAIAGYDPKDSTTSTLPVPDYTASLTGDIKGVRLGVLKEYYSELIDPEVKAAVETAVKELEKLGALAEEISIPSLSQAATASTSILLSEAASIHEEWIKTRPEDYDPQVRERVRQGQLTMATEYLKAQRFRALVSQEVSEALKRVDALILPTSRTPPYKIGAETVKIEDKEIEIRKLFGFTSIFNLTGLPAISIPCGFSESGLPIGLQIAGRPFEEEMVLRIAHAYEAHTPWHSRRPPIEGD
ncbi:MAG: Asp-tRNA(Asn)/Glu-tRNA(Gln) amidotransferase subunit GatA, partial [Candidatus Tectomicrobia bacterium]|nr:Asp-tRNA(Asn)/Glu-tRNA(Gln) amidotransferase subunit GatA [Candidatus Tectomicrobia bacterium]